jgi:hypothetical protein
MNENENSRSLLITILYITIAILTIFSVSSIIMGIYMVGSNFNFRALLSSVILPFIYFFNYLAVVWNLKSIVNTTYTSPFISDNVLRLKKMGYFLLVNTVLELIISLGETKKYIGIGSMQSTLKPVIVMCLIATLICFVLADVFKKAIKIKEDNDLTI